MLADLCEMFLILTDLRVQFVEFGRRLVVTVDGVGQLKIQLIDLALNLLGFRSFGI